MTKQQAIIWIAIIMVSLPILKHLININISPSVIGGIVGGISYFIFKKVEFNK